MTNTFDGFGQNPPPETAVTPVTVQMPFAFADPLPRTGEDLESKFNAFHGANPWLYDVLVRMTRDLKAAGHNRVGMKMLFEVLRWSWMTQNVVSADTEFKLCNSYTAYYSRLIMDTCPDLEGIFETRELRSKRAA